MHSLRKSRAFAFPDRRHACSEHPLTTRLSYINARPDHALQNDLTRLRVEAAKLRELLYVATDRQ